MKVNSNVHFIAAERYIYLVWGVGALMFIYLSLPFFSRQSGMFLPDVIQTGERFSLIKKKSEKPIKEKGVNEAYLFVNIRQKHFLTRFVTYISDEELAAREAKAISEPNENRSLLIIQKKVPGKKSSTKDDFFIGSAPKI
ncbi:MAG: hypothetical protein PHD73_02025 [Sediminibacterium sp.]|nr:hypothetical protein [Sediminibacterium sp.]